MGSDRAAWKCLIFVVLGASLTSNGRKEEVLLDDNFFYKIIYVTKKNKLCQKLDKHRIWIVVLTVIEAP